jgi:hypothetical protein
MKSKPLMQAINIEFFKRGLPAQMSWFVTALIANNATTFDDVYEMQQKHDKSLIIDVIQPKPNAKLCISDDAGSVPITIVITAVVPGGGAPCGAPGGRDARGGNRDDTAANSGNGCRRGGNGRNHRGGRGDRHGNHFTHQVGNAELGPLEMNAVKTPEWNGAEFELLCVDSGFTTVVTPHALLLSDFREFRDGQGSVTLAAKSSACSALGHRKITRRSRSTGSDLIFHNELYVPNARRTLICLGRSMRNGVTLALRQTRWRVC